MAVVAALGGLALGRFVTFDGDGTGDGGPPAAAARMLGDQISTLERRVGDDPEDLAAWQSLGSAYVGRAAETGDPAFYRLAERALDRAEALAPDDPVTAIGRGTLALARHDFDLALQLGTLATAARPSSADALAVLVDAQVELGRYEEAVTSLERMLALRPGLPALSRVSYLRELHGDLPGAIEAMQQAESAAGSPFDQAVVAALLGDLHFGTDDLTAADKAYGRALDASPGLVAADVGRARVLAARGLDDEAVALLDEVTNRFPHPVALELLHDLQVRQGETDDADGTAELLVATAALQEDAGQVVDLEMAVFEADRAVDPARAVTLARRAHAARPTNVYAADALAWALFRTGDAGAALPHAEAALRLGTADPVVRYHAAEVLAANGLRERAADELDRVYRANRWFSVRHEARAAALAAELGVGVPGDSR